LSRWGVDVYLVRRKEEPQPQDYNQAFTLLLLAGLVSAGLAILTLPFLERWVRLEGFTTIAIALFAGLPLPLLSVVPLARLERTLDYRNIALVELSGQIAVYIVALPLAYQGLGPWSPVAGVWASQLLTLGLLYRISGYRPRLHWESTRVRSVVGYGVGFSASEWLWNLANLVNPLIVGRYVGAEAVGQVSLAMRLVEQVGSIIALPAARLSLPVFARIQEDRARLLKALDRGINLQLMALGPLLAIVGLGSPWALPLLLGPSWHPVLEVYPFIALSYLVGIAFSLHSSVLFVMRRLWEVAAFRLVNLILFAGAALLLVPHLGIKGYGWAEVLHLPSWILLLAWFQVYVGRPSSAKTGVWLIVWAIPLFSWQLGPLVWISAVVPLIWAPTRRELTQAISLVFNLLRKTNRP
jgi:PST family polysaccharide transporter